MYRKKKLLDILTLLLLISYSIITISPIEAEYDTQTIFVDSNQNLQSIINSAPAEATIILNPGTYNTSFSIKKAITLQGKNKNSTFINLTTSPNNAGIALKAPNITLSNLTITNSASGLYTTAIRINSPHCKIDNCNILDTPIGIAVWSSHTEISHTSFHNCSDEGILLISTSISESHYNLIHNCSFYYNCDAIELQHSSYNTIIDCTMKYNTHSAIDAICDNNNHNLISNCIISDNKVHGIYFSSSQYNVIKNCSFLNNEEDNILFTHNSNQNTIMYKNNSSTPLEVSNTSFSSAADSTEYSENESTSVEESTVFQKLGDFVMLLKEKIYSLREKFNIF